MIEEIIMTETETEESPFSPTFSTQSSSDDQIPSPTPSNDSGIEIGEFKVETQTRPTQKLRTRHNQTKAPNIIHWTAQQVLLNIEIVNQSKKFDSLTIKTNMNLKKVNINLNFNLRFAIPTLMTSLVGDVLRGESSSSRIRKDWLICGESSRKSEAWTTQTIRK